MNLPLCVGIDLSLTGTAVCWGREVDKYTVRLFRSTKAGETVHNRIRRIEGLVGRVVDVLRDIKPDVILVEGYAFGADFGAAHAGELGGILRFELVEMVAHLYDVPPTTLKKFCAGNGKAKKELVIGQIRDQWGMLFSDNNEADAYVLWRMALVLVGTAEPGNKVQADYASRVVPNGRIEIAARPEPANAAAF